MAEVLPSYKLVDMLHNLHFDHNLVLLSLGLAHAARHGVFYARVLIDELLAQEPELTYIRLNLSFV